MFQELDKTVNTFFKEADSFIEKQKQKEIFKGWGQIVTSLSIDTKGGKQKKFHKNHYYYLK